MIARLIAVAFSLGLLGACSLGALDGFSGEGNGQNADAGEGGASSTDGSSGGPAATDSGSDAAPGDPGNTDAATDPSSLSDDHFESGALCTPWSPRHGTAVVSMPGHSGNSSCKLCSTESGKSSELIRTIKPKAPATTIPAGEYLFNVWVRGEPSAPIAFELYEVTTTDTPGTYLKGTPSTINVTDQWTPVQFSYTSMAPSAGWYVTLYYDGSPPTNTCFYADDITITRVQ